MNIKEIKELRGITSDSKGLRIGALTTLADLAENAECHEAIIRRLAEALNEAASPQIRNMATVGGNLCQRPRCWYFRNGFGLLPKDDGKGPGARRREPLPRDPRQRWPGVIRQPFDHRAGADCLWRKDSIGRTEGQARTAAGKVFSHSENRKRTRTRSEAERSPD